ncbi:hypothetical protein CPC16_010527 [Podila verticillata]|nr:hypothetical protein BGZ59_005641 [Podila verticillata]KAF9394708.1 hypothetical protein CPC16_010527 [Podila verticillata]KAI9232523.1 MAG: hypothetical protein BYD32DRAFT_466178 [Podila humilis]KFH65974.1 hypothetical protein MVEG_08076 [Podila verticillata NRRL 6337]
MATETVIYVSLALVLLTRIYVFISPPEFLEEHKDRRYHEYHLYRQYHLHKQSDKNEDSSTLQEPPTPRRLSTLDEDMLQKGDRAPRLAMEGLHHPSDELVLVGVGSGTRSLSMDGLSRQGYSKLDPLSPTTPTASPTTYTSEPSPMSFNKQRSFLRESEHDLWNQIIGSGDSGSVVPSFISLDMSEIHYNGSLERFARDPEVFEAIQELRSEPQELSKEKWPVMTVVWEGGRWCCLEGRTLYILRALDWQGQVRVRVLVDKNPTLLAVTEECWKAAGMSSDSSKLMTSGATNNDISSSSNSAPYASLLPDSTPQSARSDTQIKMSAATVSEGASTVGLSLDNVQETTTTTNFEQGEEPLEIKTSILKTRLSCLTSEGPSLPGSPGGHDADDEADETGYESDGEDDDEDDDDNNDDDMNGARANPTIDTSFLQSSLRRRINGSSRAVFETDLTEDGNNSDRTIVSPVVLSPVSHLQGKQHDNERTLSRSFARQMNLSSYPPGGNTGGGDKNQGHNNHKLAGLGIMRMSRADLPNEESPFHQKQHERKISIPEFLLPPPLHDEQVYLVVDSNNAPSNPPRRDSGHGNSP